MTNEIKPFILIAEDDKYFADIYNIKLANAGYDVVVVPGGAEVLKVAHDRKPNLILLDLVMPVMNGFEILKAVKADPELRDINVVMFSSLGMDEDLDRCIKMGAADYFIKMNISVDEMLEKVKKYASK